jgi:hypothetical protein
MNDIIQESQFKYFGEITKYTEYHQIYEQDLISDGAIKRAAVIYSNTRIQFR